MPHVATSFGVVFAAAITALLCSCAAPAPQPVVVVANSDVDSDLDLSADVTAVTATDANADDADVAPDAAADATPTLSDVGVDIAVDATPTVVADALDDSATDVAVVPVDAAEDTPEGDASSESDVTSGQDGSSDVADVLDVGPPIVCVRYFADTDLCTMDVCEMPGATCTHTPIVGCIQPTPCLTAVDCPGGICNSASWTCTGCLIDPDCGASGICVDHVCHVAQACVSDGVCKSANKVCDLGLGVCVECVSSSDCGGSLTCQQHVCVAAPQSCASSKECPHICDKANGVCVGCLSDIDCTADAFCNSDQVCQAKVCAQSACVGDVSFGCLANGSGFLPGLSCDDGNGCTTDTCGNGCVHSDNADVCSDGNSCTGPDVCSGGSCVVGSALNCDDGVACTSDSCDFATGCNSTPVDTLCDDGNVCTIDACTTSGCGHTFASTSCSDGDPCTSFDFCVQGTCASGGPTDCDDGMNCTADACDSASGCTHTAIGACQQVGFSGFGSFLTTSDVISGDFRVLDQSFFPGQSCAGSYCARGGFSP